MASSDRLSDLRDKRASDWFTFVGSLPNATGQLNRLPSVFDRSGDAVDLSSGVRGAIREWDWMKSKLGDPEGSTLCTDLGSVSKSAIQDAGIPSKLFASYVCRLVFVPAKGDEKARLYTCFTDAVGRVSPAFRLPLQGTTPP